MDAKSRFFMGLHARMDFGNGADRLGFSNTSGPRFRKCLWWQVSFHF